MPLNYTLKMYLGSNYIQCNINLCFSHFLSSLFRTDSPQIFPHLLILTEISKTKQKVTSTTTKILNFQEDGDDFFPLQFFFQLQLTFNIIFISEVYSIVVKHYRTYEMVSLVPT